MFFYQPWKYKTKTLTYINHANSSYNNVGNNDIKWRIKNHKRILKQCECDRYHFYVCEN